MAPKTENSLDIAFEKSLQLAFPPVMVQLIKALLDPSPSFSSIANYLKMDPLLAGRVLHIANTSSYAFEEKITELHRAAIAVGVTNLFKLVLALSLQKKLSPAYPRDLELNFGDWRLTLWSAMAAEGIAGHLCEERQQDAYLAGMLKDIPLYLAFCREEVPPFLRESRYVTLPEPGQSAKELALWGATHSEISRDIFLLWGFPDDLAEAVCAHHDYDNIAAHSPLAQSLIYATRWAELLHAQQVDMSRLILFELDMAATLGLSSADMSRFRVSCAERFNDLLKHLDIQQSEPALRLYDQTVTSLQNYYFLAHGTLSEVAPDSARSFAEAMRKQLRLFWGINEWDMFVKLGNAAEGSFFHCRADTGLLLEPGGYQPRSPTPGWECLPIAHGKSNFGFLAIPSSSTPLQEELSLPMFVNMVGLHLDQSLKRFAAQEKAACFADLPFVIARLDTQGRILQASRSFLNIFKLSEVPQGVTAKELLRRLLGIDLAGLGGEGGHAHRMGCFLSVPEGHFPGTPLYLARSPAPDNSDESFLFLGDVTRMDSLQALAMAHPGLLGALFDTLNEQICLLDAGGRIIWTDESCRELLGKNIFSLSRPEASYGENAFLPPKHSGGWNSSFLAGLSTSTRVQAMLALGSALVPYTLIFSPLDGKAGRQYLLILHTALPQTKAGAPRARPKAAKNRDSLTDLYGYSQFHMLLKHVAEQARKENADTGVIFCDIEGLHKFNALYGCQKGDVMLRRVAGCLAETCRPGQDYACRYGLDKFAVIVSNAAKPLMDRFAVDIQSQVRERCGEKIALNVGLVLISPEDMPKARLDAARRASEQASPLPGRTFWAE